MNAIDEYDLRESFDVLDEECQGSLSFEQLQTLYLGLGFSAPRRRMTVEKLQEDARLLGFYQDELSLEETLQLFKKYSRDRSSDLKESFAALDCNEDKHITAEDLVEASTQVNEKISVHLAQQMIEFARGGGGGGGGANRIDRKDYTKFFGPPDP